MAFFLSRPLKVLRSCPLWAKVLVVVTLASLGTRLLVVRPRVRHNEWETVPWVLESGIHNTTSTATQEEGGHDKENPFDDFKMLFVGNSYTEVNDLAGIVKSIMDHQYHANISIRSHHPGGQTFQGHVETTRKHYKPPAGHPDYPELHELRKWLVTRPLNYNWVILQEQSQIPGFWGVHDEYFNASVDSCYQLDRMVQNIPDAESETMFYLTWGRRSGDTMNSDIFPDYLSHQARLTKGYERYLEITSTSQRPTWVAPVGLVYENIYNDIRIRQRKDPSTATDCLFYQLYMDDGSHPSIYGSYLAALTMYASMTGGDPRLVQWVPEGVDADMAMEIRRAVAWTIIETVAVGVNYPWLMGNIDPEDQLP